MVEEELEVVKAQLEEAKKILLEFSVVRNEMELTKEVLLTSERGQQNALEELGVGAARLAEEK